MMIIIILLVVLLKPIYLEAGAGADFAKNSAITIDGTARATAPLLVKASTGFAKDTAEIMSKAIADTVPQLVNASENFGKSSAQIFEKTVPLLTTASKDLGKNFGKNIGLGALMFLSDKVACAGSAIAITAKTSAITIISAPATPYIVGGIVIGYGGYKLYYYYNPTTEQKTALAQKKAALYKHQTQAAQAKIAFHNAQITANNAQQNAHAAKQALVKKLAASTVASAW